MEAFVSKVIRVKYDKDDSVKFVSHLETISTFQRALRRSGLKVTHSQGFNPQMHLVFGLPIPVGVTSQAEYVDIYFDEDYSVDEVKKSLMNELTKGFIVKDAGVRNIKKKIMTDIFYAEYYLKFTSELGYHEIAKKLNDIKEMSVIKYKKNKEKVIELKPKLLLSLPFDDGLFIFCLAGGQNNLHPRLLIQGIKENIDETIEEEGIHRLEIYVNRNDKKALPLSIDALTSE